MKSFPIILIGFGVGFLLYNLQVISFTPWQIVWPSLIIWLASSQLGQIKKRQRGSEDSWEIALWLIVLTVGVYLLLPIIGIPMPSIPWAVVWPLVLILIGVLILLPGKCSFIKVDVRSGEGRIANTNPPRSWASSTVDQPVGFWMTWTFDTVSEASTSTYPIHRT